MFAAPDSVAVNVIEPDVALMVPPPAISSLKPGEVAAVIVPVVAVIFPALFMTISATFVPENSTEVPETVNPPETDVEFELSTTAWVPVKFTLKTADTLIYC